MITISKAICEEPNIGIAGATLLSVEEAQNLPKQIREYGGWWWLCSPGNFQSGAASVLDNGSVSYNGGFVSYDGGYVRPALTLSNLESSDFQVGDRFEFGGVEFEVINNNTAFCTTDLGRCAFREDWAATDANDYEASDIKKFVDSWFENAIKE